MSVCLGENIENSGLVRASSFTEYIFIQQVFIEYYSVPRLSWLLGMHREDSGWPRETVEAVSPVRGTPGPRFFLPQHALRLQESPQRVRFTPHTALARWSLQLPFTETWKRGLKERWQEIVGLRICWSGMPSDCFLLLLSLLMMSYNVCNRFVKWTPGRNKTSTSRPLSGKWKKGQLSESKNWLTYVSLKDLPCSCMAPNLTLPRNHWPSFANADGQPLTLESVEILVLHSPDAHVSKNTREEHL